MSNERNTLEVFFRPRSIAVVGASPAPGKISGIILDSILGGGFEGKVYPVNPNYDSIGGLECYRSLNDIEGGVDLAVFAVPASGVPAILKSASDRVGGAIVISGGFAETGEAGAELERELRDAVKHSGVRVIGPNCMGIYDTVSGLDTFFIPSERLARPKAGGLSIISQSGSFAVTALDELAAEGIGVARVVSYGNMADVNESDCLEFLAEDEDTTAVAIYMESVSDGRRFVKAASACADRKPVMAVKVGRTGAAAGAAHSHTGAMTGRYEVYRAAFKKAGVIELNGYDDFLSGCKALGLQKAASGKRVMVITDGGGIGVGIADACIELGLEVAPLPGRVREKIAQVLPPFCTLSNPMDLTGSATDIHFAETLEKTLSEEEYDMAIVAALWGPPALTDELPTMLAEKANLIEKPVIICSPGGEYTRSKKGLFTRLGFPVFTSPEAAVRAAAVLARGADSVRRREEREAEAEDAKGPGEPSAKRQNA